MNDCRVDPEKEHKEKKREMERKKTENSGKKSGICICDYISKGPRVIFLIKNLAKRKLWLSRHSAIALRYVYSSGKVCVYVCV